MSCYHFGITIFDHQQQPNRVTKFENISAYDKNKPKYTHDNGKKFDRLNCNLIASVV